jgi:Tol biopolymer transport system component
MTISPDGRTLLYWDDVAGHSDIYSSSPNPADHARPTRVINGSSSQARVSFSPDGQWITYTSDESGRPEVFLAPYPVNRGPVRQQVSVGGGGGSEWSADGRAVYYALDDRIWRARFNPQTGEIGKPELLSKIQPTLAWTLARDGRFLVSRVAKGAERHSIKVILNWSRTLNDTTGH